MQTAEHCMQELIVEVGFYPQAGHLRINILTGKTNLMMVVCGFSSQEKNDKVQLQTGLYPLDWFSPYIL